MAFTAGLEQFGTFGGLDWDKEFEDLVSTRSTVEDDLGVSDAMRTMDMSTKTTESELFSLEGDCDTDPVIVGSYQLAPTDEVISAEDTVMKHAIHPASPVPLLLEEEHSHNLSTSRICHPGWSEETLSWCRHTATSPQVARWAVSPGIFNDIKWIMNACKNNMADNNIPRIASSLLRAIQHVYKVPLDAGIGYPYGAYGEKFYERCLGPIHLFPRGTMGLKEPTDPDVPKDVYVPNGIKILPPSPNGQAFYPRPSPLRYVANNDDEQPPKPSESIPSLVFLSGENYFEENVEMSQSMETEEITIQEYEQESDQDAGEEVEFSSEFIETQFEIEINDRTVPSNIVDQDDEHFYASSEESRSWPSSPPLPSRELYSPVVIYEDKAVCLINDETTCDLPELALAAHYKTPEPDPAQDLDSAPFYSAYHASKNFVEAYWSSLDEDSDECGPELPGLDHITTTLNGDEIDEAISRLNSMIPVSLNDFLECKRGYDVFCIEYAPSTDGPPSIILPKPPGEGADDSSNLTSPSPMVVDLSDIPRAQSASHSSPIVGTDSGDAIAKAPPVVNSAQRLAKKPYSEGLQSSSQIAGGGVRIADVVVAVCHTIWSICSANLLVSFLVLGSLMEFALDRSSN